MAVVGLRLVSVIMHMISSSSFEECPSDKVNDSMIINDSTSLGSEGVPNISAYYMVILRPSGQHLRLWEKLLKTQVQNI